MIIGMILFVLAIANLSEYGKENMAYKIPRKFSGYKIYFKPIGWLFYRFAVIFILATFVVGFIHGITTAK